MEMLVMKYFGDLYRGKRVLVTGHTGFKGSWLTLWLKELGAEVLGISFPRDAEFWHIDALNLSTLEHFGDVRDFASICPVIKDFAPEIVFHLAAQSLVLRSYEDPLGTWSTNVVGTANVLEACRQLPVAPAIVVATTDKCYENREWVWGYRETDRLGGHDPYSASKAATEFVVSSYRDSFFKSDKSPLIASVRAGNVLGGGDWAKDRLIPDMARALRDRCPLVVRSLEAARPWQHVLDCLSGYLLLGQRLADGDRRFVGAWNFGPDQGSVCTVEEMLGKFKEIWSDFSWALAEGVRQHETNLLYLDSSKARKILGWKPVWGIDAAVKATANWYGDWLRDGSVASREQMQYYLTDARLANLSWARP